MSKNESLARELLDIKFKLNVSLKALFEFAKISIPEITDMECVAIAANYSISYFDIRNSFKNITKQSTR